MEAKAVWRYCRIAPRKARVVANLVRGRSVDEAMALLEFTPKRAAGIIKKVLKSAAANADDLGTLDVDRLYIKQITVDQGPTLRRFRPRAQGRAYRVNKKTSHIRVVVAER